MVKWRAKRRDPSAPTIARKGEPQAFLEAHLDYASDDCLLWPFGKTSKGYGAFYYEGRTITAPRWMCIAVHGEPSSERNESAHSCGNRLCVNPRHLRWANQKENSADCVIHGTSNRGERSGKTKLTESDVRAIREDCRLQKVIASEYGITQACVCKIRRRHRWGDLV